MKIFGYLFLFGASSLALFILLVAIGVFGPVPGRGELESVQQMQASRVISADGMQMGTFHLQNRTTVALHEIAPEMIDALIAIEDIRFYDHNGIDNRALARVLVRTILLRQNAGGGSTITQQLAKNLYPRENSRGLFIVSDKLREMIIARRLERLYSKDEILELYLNTVSFGEDTFGIDMASRRFFNKAPSELTLTESATLAGLLQATTLFNPHRNPERSEARRNVVLRQMERYGMISADLANGAMAEPLLTDYSRTAQSEGLAPYFREHLRGELLRILETEPALDGNTYNLNTDGLTIHTTLDSKIQRAAERSVSTRMKQLQAIFDREQAARPIFGEEDPDVLHAWRQSWHYRQLKARGHSEQVIEEILHTPVPTQLFTWNGYTEKIISPYEELRYYISFLNAGFLAMHPRTGHVLAWVGGIDHRHFHFDQVKASRQPGSAFKPVLYAAALETGREPCDYQRNILASFTDYDGWTPRNHREEYGGRYSLQAALAQSVNTVAVHLAMETGIPSIRKTASAMGINSRMPEAPSVALGTAEVSLLELTTAYTSFLNEGKPALPQFITRIYNSAGELIYDFTETEDLEEDSILTRFSLENLPQVGLTPGSDPPNQGISPETAASMVNMLEKAVLEGTGAPLRSQYGIRTAIAGKTGTTQNFTDGWFIGFTPELVFGTRVGGWNNRVRFREFPAYASQTALPIAGLFLQELSSDASIKNVYLPPGFSPDQLNTPHNLQCADYRDDRLRDRFRDFFTGQSSDEPREIGTEKEEEESRNIFRRLGRRLGL
jgi:penicillin-binding protein 1A